MGSGFQTAIIDLDGTLLKCNSFTEFVKFIFRRFPSRRMHIARIVALRKFRIVSHHKAKEMIVNMISEKITPIQLSEFVDFLTARVNLHVMEVIRDIPRKIIATAAPAIYVKEFAQRMGINEFCATLPGQPENKGEEKLRNVRKLGVSFDETTMVITDHKDDTPLLEANGRGKNIIIRQGT